MMSPFGLTMGFHHTNLRGWRYGLEGIVAKRRDSRYRRQKAGFLLPETVLPL
jgi:hypothetical protein